jgi:hypothetical protein
MQAIFMPATRETQQTQRFYARARAVPPAPSKRSFAWGSLALPQHGTAAPE